MRQHLRADVALMTLPVFQQRPRCPMTSFVIRWWTPNATQWIRATPPSTSPRHNMRQRTSTVTAAAVAPCQGACAGKCQARDASMMRTGMVSLLSAAILQQPPLPESVTWLFHLCLCAHLAYSPDSGECKRPAGKDPSSWGVEEVVSFIKDADPQALGPHTDAFRKHVSVLYWTLIVIIGPNIWLFEQWGGKRLQIGYSST